MVKTWLLDLAKKYAVFAVVKHIYQSTRDFYYRMLPIDDKLIVFEAFRSNKYADSPKAIYEYMLNSDLYRGYKFVWIFEHPEKYMFLKSKRTKLVKHETPQYYTAFARAKYWVVNGWIPLRVQKKPQQIALQCWHGTPLKRLRYDILSSSATNHHKTALRENDEDMLRYDFLISPSKFATEKFTSAFNLKAIGKEDIIIETGYPRNDTLVNAGTKEYERFRSAYNIPPGKKTILYAPTWRDDQGAEGGGYQYSSPIDFDYLKSQLGEDWILLFRSHNLAKNITNFADHKNFIRDVSDVDDINELYIASDVLITDYSSVFFDYANLRRPIIFFMYDLDHYKKDLRGFYIEPTDLPGKVIRTEAELVRILRSLPEYTKKYSKEYEKFCKKYNALDDGGATERVVKKVVI